MPENDDPMFKLEQELKTVMDEKISKNTPKPLDNPNTIPDNLTMGEGTQLQDWPKPFDSEEANKEIIPKLITEINKATQINSRLTSITIEQQKLWSKWYASGVKAKKRGFERLPPFYLKHTADYFFYCGFDGVKFEDAVVNLEDSMNHIGDI